jgi:hypothetical protein
MKSLKTTEDLLAEAHSDHSDAMSMTDINNRLMDLPVLTKVRKLLLVMPLSVMPKGRFRQMYVFFVLRTFGCLLVETWSLDPSPCRAACCFWSRRTVAGCVAVLCRSVLRARVIASPMCRSVDSACNCFSNVSQCCERM